MDYINAEQCGTDTIITGVDNFCLDDILGCGQCFRWDRIDDGLWRGVVTGKYRTIKQENDRLIFYNVSMREFDDIWYVYFDFERDYKEVKRILLTDEPMRRAIEFTPGMRVLRQDPWETLCSFILSQNNNIKRIRGLVERLCEAFGDPIDGGFAFPTPRKLAPLSPEDLAPVRAGFRAGYIIDAARLVSSASIDLKAVAAMPLQQASLELQRIRGVGPKVAACVLLCGMGRADSVPVDVWIDRALTCFYPDGMPPEIAHVAGLGQQYLFHYIRNNANLLVT